MPTTDRRKGPRSEAHSRAISLGVRRSHWSDAQSELARQGLVHDLVPARTTITLGDGRVIAEGTCHWCTFWRVSPGHTGGAGPS